MAAARKTRLDWQIRYSSEHCRHPTTVFVLVVDGLQGQQVLRMWTTNRGQFSLGSAAVRDHILSPDHPAMLLTILS
jgi:hypothetical protein